MLGAFEEPQGDDRGGLRRRHAEARPAEKLLSEREEGRPTGARLSRQGPGVGMSLEREGEARTKLFSGGRWALPGVSPDSFAEVLAPKTLESDLIRKEGRCRCNQFSSGDVTLEEDGSLVR